MSREQGCIFCEIVRGNAPCFRVDEDDQLLCFMDLFSSSPLISSNLSVQLFR